MDITCATENVSFPFLESEINLHEWLPEEDENKTAPIRNLEEWTGICKEQLPPAEMLTVDQLIRLLNALKKMLDAYNWSFVLQTKVPERVQYSTIRENFNQQAKVKRWHMGFFELCRPGTEFGKCALGKYCQCHFYDELFSQFSDEELSPEEERIRKLEIEIKHLKRKYGNDWMKYYPFYLDANYDDENANSHDYGLGDEDEDDEDRDDWWL